MKKILIFLSLSLVLTACDKEKQEYIDRHSTNYDKGYLISRKYNPGLPGTADVYDSEDFRAGSMDACNEIQKHYKKDLCSEINYWGITGPRLK
ncbi:MAG: hypothetical protein FWC61_01460 [Proteobacteria bacterium]|nr:hypothetical protein [Pseudomonadota bacterium]